jgi:hypothetical protein
MTPHSQDVSEGQRICKRGHTAPKRKQCPQCNRDRVKAWKKNPDKQGMLVANRKRHQKKHKDRINERRTAWRRLNTEVASWENMVHRCENQTDKAYLRYGGRGIRVCERWLGSDGLRNFKKDMGKKPSCKYTIERRDNNKGYRPDNCFWATHAEQQRNNRKTRLITYDGRTLCRKDWARELGISYDALSSRFRLGWSIERALGEQVGKVSDRTEHRELVERATAWLRGTMKCSVALCDMASVAGEIPDAIGWKGKATYLVECKTARLDFWSELRNKMFRRFPHTGVGMYRYYMVPEGLIEAEEVPENWGLLYVGKRILQVKKALPFRERNIQGETFMLISALRRTQLRIDQPLHEWLKWDSANSPIRPTMISEES